MIHDGEKESQYFELEQIEKWSRGLQACHQT